VLSACFQQGGKVLLCGNGGSAADAQHCAAEFVGRFKCTERPGFPAMALTADSAVLTAWSNDVGYENVFARQVEAFGKAGDVLIGISTSGRSQNVVQAFAVARSQGMKTLALWVAMVANCDRWQTIACWCPRLSHSTFKKCKSCLSICCVSW